MLLYHNPLSSCSQKVRMVLHEKGLSYDSNVIDLQKGEQFAADYVKLNPNAVVPTLIDNNQVLIESTLINEYLDDAYPDVSLKPADPATRHTMRHFCKQIDDALHPACGILTYAIGARPGLLARPKAEVDALVANIPNPARRAARRSVIDHGVAAPEFRSAMLTHRALFDRAEDMLATADWLAGPQLTLADCALMPYVVRVDHLGQGAEVTSRPHLQHWYEAIQARTSFVAAVNDWLPPPAVEMLRKAGAQVEAEIAQIMAAPQS
ncbi:MAG: glutathione S-transferase family protein [Pseudomonadota bacterium]